ncbi:hypothetical protein NP493_23g07007 [Ridgeia piscesae]|uniref:Peptidoglycan recognition protein n=1 Tax=Ridgeia piscesae TaxID=27915 RepID=A0AAD9UKE7_RIDPI|nr:hypothetical protein NP493_23g07007 [Ridgeia piscesae]
MAHTLVLLLVAVSTLAITHACWPPSSKPKSCSNNCQWSAWRSGSCSSPCGVSGRQRKTRTKVQRGTCASSKCSGTQTTYVSCRTPCAARPLFGSLKGKCSDLDIVSRSEWRARKPRKESRIGLPVDKLFIHHTVTPTCHNKYMCSARMRTMQSGHMDDKGYWDLGYNYLVGSDGKAYKGRGWGYEGGHTIGHNRDAVAISAIGNFETTRPDRAVLQAIANLIDCALKEGALSPDFKMYGHRDVACKDCPGKYLYNYVKASSHYSSVKMPKWCHKKWNY